MNFYELMKLFHLFLSFSLKNVPTPPSKPRFCFVQLMNSLALLPSRKHCNMRLQC